MPRARRREARRRELWSICAQQARLAQRVTELVREADDDGDWRAAGCSSSAAWLAQLSSSDYRSALRITRTAGALRELPALDGALASGVLTLDQVAAAAEFATPATDAELVRGAVGKAPSAIGLAARTLAPPVVEDDQALYARRALSMTWTRGRRELCLSGRLPLEQGAAFEQAIWTIAKEQRAADKQTGNELDWQQSAADALSHPRTRQRRRRGCPAPQRDDADRARQRRRATTARGRRADQRRDRRAPQLRRTPAHDQTNGARPRARTRRTLRLLRPATRAPPPLARTASTPAAPQPASSKPTTSPPVEHGGKTELDEPDPALPPPPHTPARPAHREQRHRRRA